MSTKPGRRIFEGVESTLWSLAEPPQDKPSKEQIKPTILMNQAIRVLLAEAYPQPLTVFEVTVDLLKYWKPIPIGLDDQHSSVYKNLEGGKPAFVEVSARPRTR
ncbi:MAG TPA: hypothetical protein VD973_02920 [Symbiobacteriaceae bacterium]|nr:hypothetical protein [Symbiobacteriaceae bacterium]